MGCDLHNTWISIRLYLEFNFFVFLIHETLNVFYLAQRAVLFPWFPLFELVLNQASMNQKQAFDLALTEIFERCDFNNEGLLSEVEWNIFQSFFSPSYSVFFKGALRTFDYLYEHFKILLWKSESFETIYYNRIYDIAKEDAGDLGDGISLSGFLRLFPSPMKFRDCMQHLASYWTILRRFGYNNDLEIALC